MFFKKTLLTVVTATLFSLAQTVFAESEQEREEEDAPVAVELPPDGREFETESVPLLRNFQDLATFVEDLKNKGQKESEDVRVVAISGELAQELSRALKPQDSSFQKNLKFLAITTAVGAVAPSLLKRTIFKHRTRSAPWIIVSFLVSPESSFYQRTRNGAFAGFLVGVVYLGSSAGVALPMAVGTWIGNSIWTAGEWAGAGAGYLFPKIQKMVRGGKEIDKKPDEKKVSSPQSQPNARDA